MDSMDYKKQRSVIKAHPELAIEITEKMQEHLKKILRGVIFSHQTTQKEDCIMD
jgi:hypothetical protein